MELTDGSCVAQLEAQRLSGGTEAQRTNGVAIPPYLAACSALAWFLLRNAPASPLPRLLRDGHNLNLQQGLWVFAR